MRRDQLLTARELVDELRHWRVGTWTPDAVRQWTRMEPPCPIAHRGAGENAAHLFELRPVLAWLARRTGRPRRGVGRMPRAAGEAARRALAEFDADGAMGRLYAARVAIRRLLSRVRRRDRA